VTDGRPVIAAPDLTSGPATAPPALDGRPIAPAPSTAASGDQPAAPPADPPAEASRPPVVPMPQDPGGPRSDQTIGPGLAGADGSQMRGRAAFAAPSLQMTGSAPTGGTAAGTASGLHAESGLGAAGRPAAGNATVPAQVLRQLPAAPLGAGGEQRLTVQLAPEHLGRVEVRLIASEGRLEVVLQADAAAAAQILRDSLQDLARTLSSKFEGRWQHVEVRLTEPAGNNRDGRDPATADEERPGDHQGRDGRDGRDQRRHASPDDR